MVSQKKKNLNSFRQAFDSWIHDTKNWAHRTNSTFFPKFSIKHTNSLLHSSNVVAHGMGHTWQWFRTTISAIMELFMWKFPAIFNLINVQNSHCFRSGKYVFVFLWRGSSHTIYACIFYVNVLHIVIWCSTSKVNTVQSSYKPISECYRLYLSGFWCSNDGCFAAGFLEK